MFTDADRYEMQAASMVSPMKSPHRYSPSVYLHQVACSNCVCNLYPNYLYLDSLFVTMILVYKLAVKNEITICLVQFSISVLLFVFKKNFIKLLVLMRPVCL